jgi:PAS domain S-box-containing protein
MVMAMWGGGCDMKKIAKHLQSILETISHGIVECDFLGNIVFCNRTFCEMVSYDREELIGLWIVDLSADDETKKRLTEIFESAVCDCPPIVFTTRLSGKDGRQRDFQVEWSVETDEKGGIAGFVSVFTGITDRGLEGEKTVRSLLNTLTDMAVLIDKEGIIVAANEIAEQRLGNSADELIGLSVSDLFTDDCAELIRAQAGEVLRSGKSVCLENRHDGKTYDNSIHPIFNGDGEVTSLMVFAKDITVIGDAEEALWESEDRFRSLIESSPIGMGIMRGRGNILYCNPAYVKMFGYKSMDELKTTTYEDRIAPQSLDGVLECLGRCNRNEGIPISHEYLALRKGGASFPVHAELSSIELSDGPATMAYITDIAEGERAEEDLRDSEEKYRKLVELSPDAVIIHEEGNVEFANQAGLRMFGWGGPEDGEYLGRNILEFVHPDSKGLAVTRYKRLIIENEHVPLIEMRFMRFNGNSFYGEITSIPFSYRGKRRIMIIIRDITQRKEAEEALRNSEDKYKRIFDNIQDVYYETSIDGIILEMSPSVERITGYTSEELIGRPLYGILFNPTEIDRLRGIGESIDFVRDYEITLRHKNGSLKYCSITSRVVNDEQGIPIKNIGSLRDVTERKQAEDALRDSEERYRKVVELSPDAIIIHSGRETEFVNEAGIRMFLDDPGDFDFYVKRRKLDFVHPDSREQVLDRAQLIMGREGITPLEEMRFLRANGESFYGEITATSFFTSKGEQKFIVKIHDITARKQAEGALRDSEEKYRELVENINDVIYTIDVRGTVTYISPAVERLYGYSASDIIGRSFLEFIHVDDREQIKEGFELALKGSRRGNEYRLITKSGEQRWFFTNFNVIFKGGKPSSLRGTLIDVTERKQAEEALRDSEEKYRRIFENIQDVYYETTPEGTILEISPSVERIGGYTREELIGSSAYDVYEMPDDRIKLQEDRRSLGGHVEDYRLKFKRKDGTSLHCSLNARMIFDEYGMHVKNVGLIRDLSDRTVMEDALRESERKYRTLVESASVGIILSQDGRVVFANPKVKEMLGYSDQEITSMTFEQFIAPDDREVFNRQHEFWAKGLGFPESTDFRMLDSDRIEKWIEVKSVAIEWQGRTAVMSFLNDINARKIAEEKLKYRIEFEDIITSIATQFVNLPSTEIDISINKALRAVGEFAGVDRTYIFLLSEDMMVMNNTHEWCAKGIESRIDKQKNLHLEDYQWFLGRIKGADIVYIPRVSVLPPGASSEIERIKIYDVQSLIIVPMISKESLVGFLGMDSVKEEKAWPDYIFNLLKILAQIFVNLLERKQKDDILNMYDNIISSSREQISFVDRNGIFQAVNGAFLDSFKMKRDEIIGHSLEEVFGIEVFRDNLKEHYQQCLFGHDKKFERWLNYPVLGQRYIEVSLYPFFSEGVVSGIILNLVDITDKVEIEKDILDISSRERRKIGLDLHDDLGHYLLGIAIKCRVLAQKLAENSIGWVDDALSIEESINRSIEKTRRLAKGIFPINLEKFGLAEMVKEMIENIGDVGMSFKIDIDSSIENCDIEILRHLYFIIEEGVLNAVKHSGAAHVDISLIYDDSYFILRIRDNGIGMPEVIDRRRGLGLSIMSYRARMISSSLDISRADGGGTEIIFRFKV